MVHYSDEVKQNFLEPENFGEMEDPDVVGKAGNPVCGDEMKLFLKIEDEKIVEASFQTYGCAAAIATSNVLIKEIKGKKIDEALDVSKDKIADDLGGLPNEKMHCSVLATEALENAIEEYRGEAD